MTEFERHLWCSDDVQERGFRGFDFMAMALKGGVKHSGLNGYIQEQRHAGIEEAERQKSGLKLPKINLFDRVLGQFWVGLIFKATQEALSEYGCSSLPKPVNPHENMV